MSEQKPEIYGNKKATIKGKEFTVAWRTRKESRTGNISYDLRTSYVYEKDGEEKTEYFNIVEADPDSAMKQLAEEITIFIENLEGNG